MRPGLWIPARAEPVIGRRLAPTRWLGWDDDVLNPSPRSLPIGIAQAALENLAGILARQIFEDFEVLWHFVASQRSFQLRADVSGIQRHPGLQFHHRHQRLAEFVVGNPEHGAIVNAWNRMQRGLDLGGIDVDAAGDHHVALAVADEDVTVLIDVTNIAGSDKTVTLDLGALLRLVVIGEIRVVRDARIDLADLPLRQRRAVLAEKAQLDAIEDLADGARSLQRDRKSTRLNSIHDQISYAVFC